LKKILHLAALFALLAGSVAALDLGDGAPDISPAKWITGNEADPTKPDDRTIYLVEVWSTTCPPCVRSISILNDLQKRYQADGLKIVSFTTDEESMILPFLEQHPMEYSSFVDQEGETFIKYMAADNRNTIPHAFLFDRSGRLVWIGNPLDNLEDRIKQVLDGSLNGDKALEVRSARDNLQAAYEEQNIDRMLSALGDLEALEPANPQYYLIHHRLLSQFGDGTEDVDGLLKTWFDSARDNSESLVVLAMVAIGQEAPDQRNYQLALDAAKRAFSLDFEAGLALVEVYKELGRLDLSIATLDKMMELGAPGERERVQTVRDFYQKALELGKQQTGLE
jgi:thiol-disulfide isomerase/thioredoxin